MTKPLILAALAALPFAAPALALTPDELWASWQARAADFGATLTAETVDNADGSLTLGGLTLSAPGDEPAAVPFPVTLRAAPDGSVAIEVAIPSVQDVPADVESGTPAIRLEQRGATIVARDGAATAGAGVAIDYEVAAESIRVVTMSSVGAPGLDEPTLDGVDPYASSTDLAMEVAGASLRFSDRPDAAGALAVGLSADGLAYILDTSDPFMGTTSGSGRYDGMAFEMGLTIPPGMDLAAMGDDDGTAFLAALGDGLAMRLDMAFGASTAQASAVGDVLSYDYAMSGGATRASLGLDAAGVVLEAEGNEATVSGSSPMLPVGTLEATMGPYDMEIRVPFGSEPGPFRYRVALEALTLSDSAWDAIDPGVALPREPARFVVDVTGVAAIDVAGMIAAEAAYATPPVPAIESLQIDALDVAAAGARLTGTGAFTFETDAMGMPVPDGTATVTLEGANGLLDALVAMGVVPAEQVSGARMGLAMAFEAGEGVDVMTSTIEARADGSIIVNGQKVQ